LLTENEHFSEIKIFWKELKEKQEIEEKRKN
jgi:hypothetical protein